MKEPSINLRVAAMEASLDAYDYDDFASAYCDLIRDLIASWRERGEERSEMKQLGIIRISANGTVFEVPYFDDLDFAKTVVAVRSHQGYEPAHSGIFIPYHAIDWMARVPAEVKESSEFVGMTRQ